MSERIAAWLIRQKAISTDERELYSYAVHCLFSLLYPIIFASVIGAIFGMVLEAIIMIMPFIIVRKFSGGYHADSFYKCLIISSAVIGIVLVISRYIANGIILNIIYIIASILLMIFSPMDSENKRLDSDEKCFCKKMTIILVLTLLVIVGGLWITRCQYYSKFIEMGVVLAEGLQLVAEIKMLRNY